MREHFGLRGTFHCYPLLEVCIKAREYRFLMLPYFLVLMAVYCWGQRIFGGYVSSMWLLF